MGMRGPKETLTANDKQVLIDLYMARCLTGAQLQRSVYGKEGGYGRRRLRILKERGLILSKRYTPKDHDKRRNFRFWGVVWELTNEGLKEAEAALGERILTGTGLNAPLEMLKVRTESTARYLTLAEVYIKNKNQVNWIPNFMLKHRLQAKDFPISCMSAVEKEGEMALLFGVTDDLTVRSFSYVINHIRDAVEYGIYRHILMCPPNKREMAVNYYIGKQIDGDLHVLTYEQTKEDLCFILGDGYKDLLLKGIQKVYGTCKVYPASGRHPEEFTEMVEHRPGKLNYLVDLTSNNVKLLNALIQYDEFEAKSDSRWNEGMRGVWIMVKDKDQFETVTNNLTRHPHVRISTTNHIGIWWANDGDGWEVVQQEGRNIS